jgi:hypothetical protein
LRSRVRRQAVVSTGHQATRLRRRSCRRGNTNGCYAIGVLLTQVMVGRQLRDQSRCLRKWNWVGDLTRLPEATIPVFPASKLILTDKNHHTDGLSLRMIATARCGEPTFFEVAASSTNMLRHGHPPCRQGRTTDMSAASCTSLQPAEHVTGCVARKFVRSVKSVTWLIRSGRMFVHLKTIAESCWGRPPNVNEKYAAWRVWNSPDAATSELSSAR